MARVIVTLSIMPESPDVDLEAIIQKTREFLKSRDLMFIDAVKKPVAFGLKQIEVVFTADESKGSVEYVPENIAEFEGVQNSEIIDVRRELEEKDLRFDN